MKGDKNKLISLPVAVINKLSSLAKKDRLPVKRYMEKVIINHAKEKSK